MGAVQSEPKCEAIPAAVMENVQVLHERGLSLQAYHAAIAHAPLAQWRTARGIVLAGRVAAHAGNRRLGQALHFLGWRRYPHSCECFYYFVRQLFGRRGAFAVRQMVRRHDSLIERQGAMAADWAAMLAHVCATFRDFAEAEALIEKALKIAPDNAWIHCERAFLLQQQDRVDAALDAAHHAMMLRPYYRPAVLAAAHLWQLCGEDDKALALLDQAARLLESDSVEAQRFTLLWELENIEGAKAALDRVVELTPARDRYYQAWLAGCYGDVFYKLGAVDQALEQYQKSKSPFYAAVAESIKSNPQQKPAVLLPMKFVRQQHMTCGPATLSAVTAFFGRAVEQQHIVESIWYGGTSDFDERKWASDNGWYVKEFKVSWDAARRLLDAGIPFALTTVEPGSAHLQAVVGYDPNRRTLFIRDPSQRTHREFLAAGLEERYASTGPRGLVLVPPQQAALVDGLDLPDAELYSAYYTLRDHLAAHRGEQARRILQDLLQRFPEHRMAALGQRVVALYNNDEAGVLAATEQLLKLYPNDINFQLSKQELLQRLGLTRERSGYLEHVCAASEAHPLMLHLADYLSDDARELNRAQQIVHRVLRRDPTQAYGHLILANVHWRGRQFKEAVALYRIAASLEDKDEAYALSYFRAARWTRDIEAALAWLVDRFERFGAKSSQPAVTLYRAYEILGRWHDGLAVLERAFSLRPDDGELLLFMVDSFSRNGENEQAEYYLQCAEGKVPPLRLMTARADLMARQRRPQEALSIWRALLQESPQDMYAARCMASLLANLEGPAAAIKHIEALQQRFPARFDVYQLRLDWAEHDTPAAQEGALRALAERQPKSGWVARELARNLLSQSRFDEALEALHHAVDLEPDSPAVYEILGDLYRRRGKTAEAEQAYRQAITLAVDATYAIEQFVGLYGSQQGKREALDFVHAALVQQITNGEGLLAFHAHAREVLDGEATLAQLERALAARPDLWHCWFATASQLADMGHLERALARIEEGIASFPLVPRLWLEKARIHQLQGDISGEKAALDETLRTAPHWSLAVRRLAENYERSGEYAQARQLLEKAVGHEPLDAVLRGYVARALWRADERQAALTHLEAALELAPGYAWAWDQYKSWLETLGEASRGIRFAQQLVEKRPGMYDAWISLARFLDHGDAFNDALERAIALEPRRTDAYDLKVRSLVEAQRYDEALSVAAGADWPGVAPLELRSHVPWIHKQRGDASAAVAALEALLQDEPRYYSGWQTLATWQEELGNAQAALVASQRLVELAPNESVAHVFLADAQLALEQRNEAKLHLARALALNPAYGYAGLKLLDLQLHDGELTQAASTLALLAPHADAQLQPFLCAREIALAAKQGKQEHALALLDKLVQVETNDAWPFNAAGASIDEGGWGKALDAHFQAWLQAPAGVNPLAGAAWVKCRQKDTGWRLRKKEVEQLLTGGDVGYYAMDAYLDYLLAQRDTADLFHLLRRHRKALREHARTWATIGYVLVATGRYKEAVLWLSDWPTRSDVRPWTLHNLATALRERRRWKEAWKVGRAALEMEPDHTATSLRIWVALEEGIQGEDDVVIAASGRISAANLGDYDRHAQALLDIMQLVIGRTPHARAGLVGEVRRHLRAALRAQPAAYTDHTLAAVRRRVLWSLARRIGPAPRAPLYALYWWLAA